MPGQTYIQIPGNGFRIKADRQKDEFERPGELQRHWGHITLARCNMYGTIKRVIRDRGFGFIRSQDGEEIFFHRTSVEKRLDFDALREGQRVEFDLQRGDKGPRAASVRSGPGELMSA